MAKLGQCVGSHQRRTQRHGPAHDGIAHPERQLVGYVRIPVSEQVDSVPTAGVASVEATTVKWVPAILNRHMAMTVC